MPDDAAKGFARSVSLEEAAAEGAKLCASPLQPPHTHTHQHHPTAILVPISTPTTTPPQPMPQLYVSMLWS